MTKLSIGSCFSGIGGLELGLEWTGGFETKWQIEFDPYAAAVLAKHWPGVQRFTDIRDVVRPPAVDVICGGFPCQDVSLAGARAGLEGKRSTLWGEMFRLVCEIRPKWLLAENVPGLLSSDGGRFFGNILRDLASIGFDAEWGVLSAAGVGAPHLRRRVFLLAYSLPSWKRRFEREGEVKKVVIPHARLLGSSKHEEQATGVKQLREDVANPKLLGWEKGSHETRDGKNIGASNHPEYGGGQWSTEPDVGRVANGVPSRVHRLRCLGNAVVPQVAQKIGEMILNFESKGLR